MFMPNHRHSPLVRTLHLTMLVTITIVISLFTRHLISPAEPVQDRHVDGELLQGLMLISDTTKQTGPLLSPEKKPCTNAQLTSLLAKISAVSKKTGMVLREPDCNQADVTIKAANWLLQYPSQISSLLAKSQDDLEDSLARRDPFRLPGCLFQHGEPVPGPASKSTEYCKNDPGWRSAGIGDLPPGTDALWATLSGYRAATREQSPNTFHYQIETSLDTPLVQGRHQFLSLDASIQTKAQLTAACYTGDSAACSLCPWCNTQGAKDMFENARARMLGILVVDAHTGGIIAAGSSHTRCYAAQYSGKVLTDCPALPTPPANRQSQLNNHILEERMPASLVKIALAAGLIETGIPAASRDAMVSDWLVRSDTEAFIDTVLCKDQQFDPNCAKTRLAGIQRMTSALGWNSGCDGTTTVGCGQRDLLDAGLLEYLNYPVLIGRLLLDENNVPLPIDHLPLNINSIQACYKGGHEERWRYCHGFGVVINELFGQGNAMATPIGIAQLLLQLSAAESGQAQAPVVHLLEKLDAKTETMPIAPHQPLAMKPETAQAIVSAIAQTHLRGTAHAACINAAQPGGLLRCRDAKDMPFRIGGKTGTPLFSADKLPLEEWRRQCAQPPKDLSEKDRQRLKQSCGLSPIKWYAALVGKSDKTDWDQIVVVLAERNWNQRTGLVDSSKYVGSKVEEDVGSNVAAEVGLAVANALNSPTGTEWKALTEPAPPSPLVTADKPKPALQAPVTLQNSPQPALIPKPKPKPKSLRYHHYS